MWSGYFIAALRSGARILPAAPSGRPCRQNWIHQQSAFRRSANVADGAPPPVPSLATVTRRPTGGAAGRAEGAGSSADAGVPVRLSAATAASAAGAGAGVAGGGADDG